MFDMKTKEDRPVDEVGARIAEELVRQHRFPGIEFRSFSRRRLACVKGRLEVWQVMMIARSYENDIQGIADHLVMRPDQVQDALDYYAAYPDEIDALLATNDEGYDRLKRMFPNMGLTEITDEAIARIEEKYHFEDATKAPVFHPVV